MRGFRVRRGRSRRRGAIVGMVLLAGLLPAGAADGQQVIAQSENFELVNSLRIPGVVVSQRAVGDTFFASSWQSGLYSYDISDPTEPVQLGHMGPDKLLVQSSENEDMATNGKILLLSRFNRTPANNLFVIDVSNPKEMEIVAEVPGGGGHTVTCLYGCKWAYGSSSGSIVDLRNPKKPKLLDNLWTEVIEGTSVHDLTEVKPGLIVTSSNPMFAIDVKNPAKPRVLAQTEFGTPHTGHNNIWPRGGRDRFLISASEGSNNGRCEMFGENGKTLQIWRTDGWQKKGFEPAGAYTLSNGTYTDGNPLVSVGIQGCSSHWAQEHPSFRNGGLVAMAGFSHGVRLLDISSTGKPKEAGWFLKEFHQAVDVEWVGQRLLYVVEDGNGGGIDIIRYTGRLR